MINERYLRPSVKKGGKDDDNETKVITGLQVKKKGMCGKRVKKAVKRENGGGRIAEEVWGN